MDLKAQLQAKRRQILALAAKHGTSNLRLFGSMARGGAGPKSDVDIFINLESRRSLLNQIILGQDLEDLLGCKVDVVTEAALH
ncbi:nucleotidyltransferase family protein [Desulfobacca acetoxidans]|uniref:DNA polymerase beta domain protein region n=1 Tax=Desulfobacca acetoxidans (strain ATCC 700848 / DSM 11109 / ASRB2) TaxID=880072 RepID=F2NCZ3_DESAR|nr:nucleotidyltransferase family protein [Desulfobacca acetoxidans]AEB09567.1 DNA polymerase beta domain protein region [Desulfobacca acetoxidans DSM 11109]